MSASAQTRVLIDDAASTVRGILLVILSYMILTLGDVAAKWALLAAGVAWAMLWRGVFGGIVVSLVTVPALGADGRARFRPVRW